MLTFGEVGILRINYMSTIRATLSRPFPGSLPNQFTCWMSADVERDLARDARRPMSEAGIIGLHLS